MSRGFKFIVLIIGILAISVFLTPVVYHVLPFFKFEKILKRLIMIFFVASAFIYALMKRKKNNGKWISEEALREYGLDFRLPWLRLIGWGFLVGIVAVSMVIIPDLIFGPRYLRHPILLQDVIERFFKGLLSGVVVGFIEEFFFRGFIYQNVLRKIGVFKSILVTSIFYSLVHFLNYGQIFVPENPGLADAFRLLAGYLEPMVFRTREILPLFVGLLIFGVALNVLVMRSGSLFMSIGLHAGAVFLVKFEASFVRKGLEDYYHPFFGNPSHYDGWYEWLILSLLVFMIWWLGRRFQTQAHS